MNGHGSFICNTVKLETTQMFIFRLMEKQTVVYTYSAILLNSKKVLIIDIYYMDES